MKLSPSRTLLLDGTRKVGNRRPAEAVFGAQAETRGWGAGLVSDSGCSGNGPLSDLSQPARGSGAGPSGKGAKRDAWAKMGEGRGRGAEHYRQSNTGGETKDRDKRWLTFERRL